MRKSDLKVGESYAFHEGHGAFYLYSPTSHRMKSVLRTTHPVEVLDLNYEYDKKISTWSVETRKAKGIRIRLLDRNKEERTLPSGSKLVMKWSDFLSQTKEARAYFEKEERAEKAAIERCQALVKRAKAAGLKVEWSGDEENPEFTIPSEREMKKLLDRLETKK